MARKYYRILIVETDAQIRQQAMDVLSEEGFFCDLADNGQQATDMLDIKGYDAVVCDLRVRSGKGHSFCLDVLQRTDHPVTLVITDEVQANIVDALKARGAAEVSFKPVDFTALAANIRELVIDRDTQSSGSTPASSETNCLDEPATPQTNQAQNIESGQTVANDRGDVVAQNKRIVTILMNDAEGCAALSQKLEMSNFEAITAGSSEGLYQVLNQQRVDLVVIENDLSGFLSGMEILQRLYDDLIRPEAILLAEENDNVKKKAKDLGIKAILNPNTNYDEIVDVINGFCADVSSRNEIILPKARRLVQEFEGIPPLPHLIMKLMNYMAMEVEEIPMKELANDISFDPKAITDLLKMTNSSSMGLGRKITNVMDAVALLGAKRTISLIFASTTLATQSKLLKGWSKPLRKWYHQRSILIASTAATFAQKLGKVSPDTAFVLGLLQEIGILVMSKSLGNEYSQHIQRTLQVGQLQLHLIEEKEYRMTHADVSAALLQKWKFPQSLIGPVLDHHNAGSTLVRSNVERSFLHAMRVGEAIANLSDLAHPIRCQALNQLLDEYGEEKGGVCRECIQESIAKTAESCKLFSLPVPDEETMGKLMETIAATEALAEGTQMLEQASS